eukprot:gene10351-11261_t
MAHWNKLKGDIDGGRRKLNSAINTLNEISWGAKNKASAIDYDGFNERVRISLAGSFYEVKRSALVQDPAIGWNRLSCLFKKRWEKFLLCDKNGRIYESEWMKPILQALKGEVDMVLDKSSNNVSAWYGILSRFQIPENIKFKESNDEKNLKPVKRMVVSYPSYNRYYSSDSTTEQKKVDVKAVTITRTPLPRPTIYAPSSFVPKSGFSNPFFQSNEVLKAQLALLNQSGPMLFKMEEVLENVQANLLTFLQELTFMGDFLYSEWKDIIPSLTKMKDITSGISPEESIEKHIKYFATIFPIIQDYKHRVRSASSEAERRQLDGLAYFNVEGERMVIRKCVLLSVFGESQKAVRLSGRWTEQLHDVDEEGNIYYDVSPLAFRALLQYARFRSFHLKGPLTFSRAIQIPQSLLDYFSIVKSSVSSSEYSCD